MKTQAQTQKERFASNRQLIETVIGLNIMQYNTLQYTTGLDFLKLMFFEDNPNFQKWFYIYERDVTFWKWWIHEWNCYEADILFKANIPRMRHRLRLNKKNYLIEISRIPESKHVQDSFSNHYLKYLQYDNVSKNASAEVDHKRKAAASKNHAAPASQQ